MGNELKLSLENFQSISQGELIFHTGTNAIVGQSNSGKTATFRALKACLSNPTGSQRFIKEGTSKSVVTLEYNGNQIVWVRTPKESSYIINGEKFIKTGRSNAFKLLEDTGFTTDSNDTIMNIEEELQLPFPFGISKTDLFKLYENVFCVSDSAIILKAANGKEEETKNNIVALENDLTKNRNKQAAIKSFKEEVDIDFLKGARNSLLEKSSRVKALSEGLDIIHKAVSTQEFRVKEKSFTNRIPKLKESCALKKQISTLKELHDLCKDLKGLEIPQEIDLVEYKVLVELGKLLKKLKKTSDFQVLEEKFTNKLENYENLKEISDVVHKLKKVKSLKVPEETFVNKLDEYIELKEYIASLKFIEYTIKDKEEQLHRVKKILEEKEGQLKGFRVCPLCHRPLE